MRGSLRDRRALGVAGLLVAATVVGTAAPALADGSIPGAVAGTKAGQIVGLGSGTYTWASFGSNSVGVDLAGKGGLNGVSKTGTVVQMNPYSSNKAGWVPTAAGTSNQLYLVSASGAPKLSNFSLLGTPQGHDYNGLRILNATGARVTNVKVAAVPGSGYIPPRETFAINDQRSTGSIYSFVEEDGANIGASGIAANSSTGITIANSSFVNNRYSAGVALWQTTNAVLTDVTSRNNRTGINLERTSGTVTITRPTILNSASQDFYIGSNWGSAKIVIIDPVYSGTLRMRVPPVYQGSPNKQLRSDIRVLVGGVDRTASVVTWLN